MSVHLDANKAYIIMVIIMLWCSRDDSDHPVLTFPAADKQNPDKGHQLTPEHQDPLGPLPETY